MYIPLFIVGGMYFIQGRSEYDMVYSYQLVVLILIMLSTDLKKIRFIEWIIILVGTIFILLYGSRGPLVIISVYMLLRYLKYLFQQSFKLIPLVLNITFFTFLTAMILFFNYMAVFLIEMISSIGIDSRTLYLVLNANQDIDFTSGRMELYIESLELILDKPIFGYGVLGERSYFEGNYPHNIFLEIILHFGVFIGGAILIYILIGSIKKFIYLRDQRFYFFLLIFCMSIVHLSLSGTYLNSLYIFLLFFLILYEKRVKT